MSCTIWRTRRLYGFFGYEGLRETTPATRVTRVPTALERTGDFSQSFNANGAPVVIFDPLTTRPDPDRPGRFIRDPFPGNRIPANRLDPVAVSALALLPVPNQEGRTPARLDNLVLGGLSNTVENDRYDGRIDWVSKNRHALFARFTKARQDSLPATCSIRSSSRAVPRSTRGGWSPSATRSSRARRCSWTSCNLASNSPFCAK
jgi:hypothetical protein